MQFISIGLDHDDPVRSQRWSSERLEYWLQKSRESLKVAIVRAIDEGSKETKELAIREFAMRLNCPRREIERRIFSEKVTVERARGTIRFSAKPIDLKYFRVAQMKKGVSVNTGERNKVYSHAFGPNIKRLGGNVFIRSTASRLPIIKIRGVSLARLAKDLDMPNRLGQFFRRTVKRKIVENTFVFSTIRIGRQNRQRVLAARLAHGIR